MTCLQHELCMCAACVEGAGGVEAFHAIFLKRIAHARELLPDTQAVAKVVSGMMMAMEQEHQPNAVPDDARLVDDKGPLLTYPLTYGQARALRAAVMGAGGDVRAYHFKGDGTRSAFSWGCTGSVVWLADACRPDAMSVTNDAEAVVAYLRGVVPLAGKRIVYRDSDGRWDEIKHEAGAFKGFASLGASTLPDALLMLGGSHAAG